MYCCIRSVSGDIGGRSVTWRRGGGEGGEAEERVEENADKYSQKSALQCFCMFS